MNNALPVLFSAGLCEKLTGVLRCTNLRDDYDYNRRLFMLDATSKANGSRHGWQARNNRCTYHPDCERTDTLWNSYTLDRFLRES